MAVTDPKERVKRRISAIKNRNPDMDIKEESERREATKAYVKEDQKHFVAFLEDCVDTSATSMQNIRREQDECWQVFNEEEPDFYNEKDDWQSHVIFPKPYQAVQFAMAAVRKSFDIQFLSVTNKDDKDAEKVWSRVLEVQLGRNKAKFPIKFTDASGMGFAIGTSMEMIPQWRPGNGLNIALVEPWKIHRDPDALSRDPQSGMYWIHQEWLDLYLLKHLKKVGRYNNNVNRLSALSSSGGKAETARLTKEEIARRKNQVWSRGKFRNMLLVSEFWGTLLDQRGDMLLPNATYTVAAGTVIQDPEVSPYRTLRWPGIAFSPLPNFLRFDGRSLLHSVKSLWHFMCGLLCLHADNLNWHVNPPVEINIQGLVNPADTEFFPGKEYHVRETVSGQQVIRPVDRKSITGDILANLNFASQNFDRGSMVHDVVQGLPGYRGEAPTARGQAQDLEQSLTVFSLVGRNIEDGALNFIAAAAETIAANISFAELADMVGEDLATKFIDKSSVLGVTLPAITDGDFEVSGISAMLRDWEIVRAIRETILPMFENELFVPYGRPYGLWKSLERRLNLKDEGLLIEEDRALRIDAAQQVVQEAAIIGQAQQLEAAAQATQNQNAMADAQMAAASAAAQPPEQAAPALMPMQVVR